MKRQYNLTSIFGLTFILFFILFSAVHSQNSVSNHTEVEELTPFVKEGLNVLNIEGIQLIILPIEILPQYNNRSGIYGMLEVETVNKTFTIYRLYIDWYRPINRVTRTIAHELIHVLQHYQGRLYSEGDNTVFEGKTYKESFPYMLRPWESEAFNNATRLKNQINDNLN